MTALGFAIANADRAHARTTGGAINRRLFRDLNDDGYGAWLDERDARVPLTRADLHSINDDLAAEAVAAGGGMDAVLEATICGRWTTS